MATKPIIAVAAATDVGCIRKNNEDSYRFLADGPDFWAAIADGCGGEAAGEVASRISVEVFAEELARHRESPRDPAFVLRDAVITANRAILAEAQEEGKSGMGTTFSAVFLRGKSAFTAHAGDSRIYRKRRGRFERLTVDHTWVQEQVKLGRMTEAQAETHPRSGILMKALGTPDFKAPDIDYLDVLKGDTLLLSSDGLHRVVTLAEIERAMDGELDTMVNDLIALALKRGAPDNVSIIAFRVTGFSGGDSGTLDDAEPV